MNLWNKKVYDVVFRLCGCACGHGYLKREEEIELPQPKYVETKKNKTKAQMKPELKDVKLKKAKKLSSKSALSDSFKRSQPKAGEVTPAVEPQPAAELVYIPGLPEVKNKVKKRTRKTSSSESDSSLGITLNPVVSPFLSRYLTVQICPSVVKLNQAGKPVVVVMIAVVRPAD